MVLLKCQSYSLPFFTGIDRYGCPDIEEIENFNRLYKQKLDKIIERGEISLDLALEASYLTEL